MYRILIIETGEYVLCSNSDRNILYTPQEIKYKHYNISDFSFVEYSTEKETQHMANVGSYIMVNHTRIELKSHSEVYEIVEV